MPQPVLKSGSDEQARHVSRMFDRIAGWYDFLNHLLSLGLDIYWRRCLVRLVRPGSSGRVLDLAAGTLDVACEIVRQHPSMKVLALDFSLPMLQRGRRKLHGHRAQAISVALADGRRLPVADASVDCVTIAFGIRNIIPRQTAFSEIFRVLRPGGRLCILEFGTGRERIWGGVYNFYLRKILPGVGRMVSGDDRAYRYLAETILAFPDAAALERELNDCGYAEVTYRAMLSGIVYLHAAHKPAQPEIAP